jgi:hypothetical protein
MARTRRDVRYATWYARPIRHRATILAEQRAAEELREHGFNPRGRVSARAGKKAIPSNWDDRNVAACKEVDFRRGGS